ncbi:MAG: OsmC family protein [Chitinophagaceae bacterium]|uniref:OsmC family protein n=1 Tax=unclassified Paraflavitalea TaxID=2798305 RepID=UPI003D34A335|nr:OsmC family protein [Chitinophagaceae bacterium]
MKRSATAIWKGAGKDGKGHLTTQSKVMDGQAYDFKSRFEDGTYTNPEELIAAAHAGCFAMKLSFVLGAAGFTADELDATATVTLDNGAVTSSALVLKAKIPGIDEAKFQECAADAKANCPISKLLNAEISLDASLI